MAAGGEAGGERGSGRPDQERRRHARPRRLLARPRPAQGRAVLGGDGPIRPDHPLRQKGPLLARLHLPAALRDAHEPRARPAVRAAARGRGRVHGEQPGAAVQFV